jgi:carboxylesterase type B
LTAYGGRDDGLFHAAAAESQSFGPQLTVAQAQYQYDSLVSRTGCSDSDDTLQCLRDLPIETLQAANTNIPYPGGVGNPLYMYSNVIDGNFTTDYTYKLISEGSFIKVPVIFG